MTAVSRVTRSALLSAGVILLFCLLFAGSAGKPFHLDDMDFAAAADTTAHTGVPVYYRGEENRYHHGIYHPPLYIYMLAAWTLVFNSTPTAIRLFGMCCAVLQGWIVLAILRTLFGGALAARWAPWFWVLYLLNPFTLQTATIVDIDSTIYGPLLCAVILATLRISWRDGEWRTDLPARREYAVLTVLLALCLWAKLTTVWLTFPFVFMLLIARLGNRRAAVVAVAAGSASIALFAATYALYGLVSGLDITETFAFTWMSFTQRGASAAPGLAARLFDLVRNFRFMFPFMMSWSGVVPWLAAPLALLSCAAAVWKRRDRRMLHYGLVLGLAYLCTLAYCAKVATFGMAPFKYVLVYWGALLSAPVLLMLRESSPLWTWSRRVITIVAFTGFAAGTIWAARFLGDRLILDQFRGPYTLGAALPGSLFVAGILFMGRVPAAGGMAAAALAFFSGTQFGTVVYQAHVPYSTTYDYGQTGLEETAAFLNASTQPDEVVVCMKDVGYRANRRYFENYQALYLDGDNQRRLEDAIASGHARFVVFTENRGQDQLAVNPSFREWFLARCTLVRSFGNYRVYQLTSALKNQRDAGCSSPADVR